MFKDKDKKMPWYTFALFIGVGLVIWLGDTNGWWGA
jgi:hypothetical protein